MTDQSTVMPVVEFCVDPEGHNWKDCHLTLTAGRTIGLTEVLGPGVVALGPEKVAFLLSQEMAINPVSDSKGVKHMLPPQCKFLVHIQRGAGSLGDSVKVMIEGGFLDLASWPKEGDRYIACLSSPDTDLDELLADSPEWTDALMRERLPVIQMERERRFGPYFAGASAA